jgi:3-deoxy-7-phosphoheptulonate synthase
MVAEYADVMQVGARNMQNYSLLERLGAVDRPILLKRGLSATIKEWLMAAEYIVAKGNPNVALCERGIRTFETATRNTLDINAIPVLKALTHLPVLVDPSHGIGIRQHVAAIARAGIAAGADGIIVEVHPRPEKALSDGHQSLTPAEFEGLMRQVRVIASAVERPLVR